MVGGFLKAVCYPYYGKATDDTYIYYLTITRALCISALLSLLYWITFVWDLRFNLGLFAIRIDPENALRSMLSNYVVPVGTIELLFSLSYGLLLFRSNIDFGTIDLIHWSDRIAKKTGGTREGIMRYGLIIAFFAIVASYSSSGPILYVLQTRPYLNNSPATVFILLILCTWIIGIVPSAALTGIAIAYQQWKRLGPRFKAAHIDNN